MKSGFFVHRAFATFSATEKAFVGRKKKSCRLHVACGPYTMLCRPALRYTNSTTACECLKLVGLPIISIRPFTTTYIVASQLVSHHIDV